MGRNVYLTDREIIALRDTASEWCSMMAEGEDTARSTDERLFEGLGSALKKLYKGSNGEKVYQRYDNFRENRRKEKYV